MTPYCGNLANFIIYLLYSIQFLFKLKTSGIYPLKKKHSQGGDERNLLNLTVAVNIFDSLRRSALPFEINANLP